MECLKLVSVPKPHKWAVISTHLQYAH